MKKLKVWRQGDVLFTQRIQEIPKDFEKNKDGIVAFGEVSTHAHRVDKTIANLYVKKSIDLAISHATAELMIVECLKEGQQVTHEEHESLSFPVGLYDNHKQVEWDWFSKMERKVKD